jgi:uncharacterized delta-60 repeat protein
MKALLLLPFLFLLLHGQAQDGTLDPTFGTGGFVRLAQPIASSGFTSDGKLVGLFVNAAGNSNLIRYNTDGTLDASYGSSGVIHIPGLGYFIKITVLNNSDVLVLREVSNYSPTGRYVSDDFVLSLYSPDGSVRWVTTIPRGDYRVPPGLPIALGLFSDNDKSWFAYRQTKIPGEYLYSTIVIGVLGGAPNLPFSGSPRTPPSGSITPFSITMSQGGKIYVGGTETGYFDNASSITTRLVVQRFNSNGVPDSTYGTNSVVASNLSPGIANLVVQNDGKLLGSLVDQNGSPENKLLRFNADGNVDASFGSNGVVTAPFTINKTIVESDGKILVGGTLNGDFALARYNADGTLDLTFGNGGVTTTDFGGSESITNMRIVGNRLYAYGSSILAAYQLTCTPPTFLNDGTIVANTACGKSEGAIYLVPLSGTAPFQYSINGGATYISSLDKLYGFTGLAAGTYQLRIKDANGCESDVVEKTVSSNCPTTCTPPTFLNDGTIVANTACGKSEGAIYLVPTSGTAPFQYSIDGGQTYISSADKLYGFTGLAAGTYQLRIKDAGGCQSAVIERVVSALDCPTTCTTPPTLLDNGTIIGHATCGKSDGALYLIPTSGTAPFLYSINGGTTYVSGPDAGTSFSGLAAGVYQLRIKDASGCESAVVQKEVLALYGSCAGVAPKNGTSEDVAAGRQASVLAYPNPTKGVFRLQLQHLTGKVQVMVLNSLGAVVEQRRMNVSEGGNIDFNLTGKAKGLYFVRVVSEKGVQVSKVLVQ